MLASALHVVNRAVHEAFVDSCEPSKASDTIGAKIEKEEPAMGNEENLVVIEGASTERAQLTRRAAVQRLLTAMSAGAAFPLTTNSHPVFEILRSHARLHNDAILDEPGQLGQANWKPAFLTSQQNELLAALAESIVPGSTRAHVSRFLDLLLSVDTSQSQRKFLQSLAALDVEAQKRLKKSFLALDEEQKGAFLTSVSTKLKNPETLGAEAEKKQAALYSHFENLKGWISGAYYSSEVGMRDLGWTGDYAFAAFPGCTHLEGHH